MKNKNIFFVACDTSNLSEIKKIIRQTQTKKLNNFEGTDGLAVEGFYFDHFTPQSQGSWTF